jgi:uncharacterized membrane protein
MGTGWLLPLFEPIYSYVDFDDMWTYVNLLIVGDVLLILCGAVMYWLSPRCRRNWLLGYGSVRSMINDAAWQRANRFAGQLLSLTALLSMCLHAANRDLILTNQAAQTVFALGAISTPLFVMFVTEKYLARTFKN